MKHFRNPSDVHKPLAAYSHQVELDSKERLLILSGQIGMMKDGTIPGDTVGQLKVAMENIRLNLEAANMGMDEIVKLTFYIVGPMDANERKGVIKSYLGDHEPCMTLIFVASLASPQIKIEIEAMASGEVS